MTFQARATQQEGAFGSQELILIDADVKPDPPELFECSPEWCKFFSISIFSLPGLVKSYSQIDHNKALIFTDLFCLLSFFNSGVPVTTERGRRFTQPLSRIVLTIWNVTRTRIQHDIDPSKDKQ